jgi:hypothetical protein
MGSILWQFATAALISSEWLLSGTCQRQIRTLSATMLQVHQLQSSSHSNLARDILWFCVWVSPQGSTGTACLFLFGQLACFPCMGGIF